MRLTAHRYLPWLLAFAVILLTGCPTPPDGEECNRDPHLVACRGDSGYATLGDASVVLSDPELLTYREKSTKDGTRVFLGSCGAFTAEIQWQMPNVRPEDGYIIQRVYIKAIDAFDPLPYISSVDQAQPGQCFERPDTDYVYEYWEMWNIAAGTVADPFNLKDEVAFASIRHASGELLIELTASYYTESEIDPATDPAGFGHLPEASNLAATLTKPAFWDGIPKARIKRSYKTTWECCPRQQTVLVSPVYQQ